MPIKKKKNDKRWIEEMRRDSFRWMGIGVEFCIVVGGATWLGHWLDTLSKTSPGFMIMGFFAGFIWMLYTMIKRAGGFKG